MTNVFAITEDLARRRGVDDKRISVIELNRSGPSQSAIALLAFEDGGPDPVAFIKATTDRERAAALHREFDNLTRLSRVGDEAFRRTVPEPLYCERLGELTLLAETARAGTRMKDFPPDRYFASRRFGEDYAKCMGWLLRFREALDDDRTPVAADAAESAVARYRDTHRLSPGLDALLDEACASLRPIGVPGVPSHGDFCTANVIVPEGDEPFVIDWEYPLIPTWPLADLLYFTCSTWCVPYRKGRQAVKENYERLFFERHGFSERIRHHAERYLERLGLAPELILPLSVVCWVAFANRKHDEVAGRGRSETGHLPLILVADGACANLEILADNRGRYLR